MENLSFSGVPILKHTAVKSPCDTVNVSHGVFQIRREREGVGGGGGGG